VTVDAAAIQLATRRAADYDAASSIVRGCGMLFRPWKLSSPARVMACAAVVTCALGTVPSVRAQPVQTAAVQRLAERVATEGKVRVIVGLNLPARADGLLRANERSQQRANIRAAQNAVADQLLAGTAARLHTRFDTIPFLAAEVDAAAMARLRTSPLVRHLQEDRLARPTLLQSAPLVGATTAWSRGHTGAGWTVAVLDTGVDQTHSFLAGKVVSEACYSSNFSSSEYTSQTLCPGGATATTAAGSAAPCAGGCEHGTHVAGIAAGGTAQDGSHGVARDAGIIAVQVFSYFPAHGTVLSWTSDQVLALERVYALRDSYKIAAVNLSLGGGRYSGACDGDDPATKTAIDNLRSVGIATVVAAGNNGWTTSISAPACISSAISVAASCDVADGGYCTGVDGIAGYSNMADLVSLVAPGSVITSAVPGGGYAAWHGTSMATPQVAGAWAVLKQAQPGLGVTEALALLRSNGVSLADTRSGGSVTGLRRIDVGFLEPTGFTLSVSRTGTGAGSVASADGHINCGSACDRLYTGNPTVTLTATAAAGSVFTGWSGDCAGSAASCSVSMTAARSVSASFATAFTLQVARAGAA
jgi:subtilisin family serine protease